MYNSNFFNTQKVFRKDELVSKLELISSSKGNQKKWCSGDYWLKEDRLGYESLAEVVCSLVLDNITNLDYKHVQYDLCTVIEENKKYVDFCYSRNFLEEGEKLITFRKFVRDDLRFDKQYKRKSVEEKFKFICNTVGDFCDLDFEDYLLKLSMFDLLVLNDDRHLNNIAIIKGVDGKYKYCPIFDNGGGLLSDLDEYNMDLGIIYNINKVQIKPIERNPKKLLTFIKSHTNFLFTLDKESLYRKLASITFYNREYKERCINTLKLQLDSYENILWRDVK